MFVRQTFQLSRDEARKGARVVSRISESCLLDGSGEAGASSKATSIEFTMRRLPTAD